MYATEKWSVVKIAGGQAQAKVKNSKRHFVEKLALTNAIPYSNDATQLYKKVHWILLIFQIIWKDESPNVR